MKEKYLQYVDNLKNSYDAYYFQNKCDDITKTTHSKEFIELINLLEKDDISLRALGWIRDCYDCYYKDELELEENKDNAFNYLIKTINKLFEE